MFRFALQLLIFSNLYFGSFCEVDRIYIVKGRFKSFLRMYSWKTLNAGCRRYALERRRMKVSRSKTEYLNVNGGNYKETVKMEDKKVPRVNEFKYLGSTVKESGSYEREV